MAMFRPKRKQENQKYMIVNLILCVAVVIICSILIDARDKKSEPVPTPSATITVSPSLEPTE